MLLFAEVDDAVLGELIDLTLDHAQRDVAQQPDDVERVLRERHRHRLDVEEIAGEHRDVVAPLRVDGLPPAPHIRIVDDVVVHQRRGVNELDDGGVEHGARPGVAAQARAHQQHRRAHALAAALQQVVADLRNDVDLRLDLPRKLALDRLEILADGLEQLNEIRLGPGCGVRHVRRSHHTDRAVSTRAGRVNALNDKALREVAAVTAGTGASKLRSVCSPTAAAVVPRTAASCSTTFAT